jgi:hypothetical protein
MTNMQIEVLCEAVWNTQETGIPNYVLNLPTHVIYYVTLLDKGQKHLRYASEGWAKPLRCVEKLLH